MPMPNPRQYLTISQQNNTIMLPRRIATAAQNNNNNNSNVARLNATFVADNSIGELNPDLKLKHYYYEQQFGEYDDGTNSISASGNIEAETNKLELVDNDEFDKYKSGDDSSASASNTIVRKDRLTMEYNEEAEEQKNLNESSVYFDGTQLANGNGNEDVENEKNHHESQVTTALDLSIATDEDVAAINVGADDDSDDDVAPAAAAAAAAFDDGTEVKQQIHEFQEAIDKITTSSTTVEDLSYDESDDHIKEAVGSSISHSNLAINGDREDGESSADEGSIEMSEAFNKEWADLNEEEEDEILANSHIAVIEEGSNEIHVPVDLSNDIIVNDYAAAHNVPYNPDAEFIDVTSTTLKNSSMPMLEKLSMK